MRRDDYAALGGHVGSIVTLQEVLALSRRTDTDWPPGNPWPYGGLP
jgi:hypothetical protein